MSDNLTIQKGKTFTHVLRWGKKPVIYKAITGISKTAPAVLDVVGHGLPNGWPVAVSAVEGMEQINAQHAPPRESEFHPATVLNSGQIELNDVNAALFDDYVSGGYIEFDTPVDLTGAKSRFVIRDKEGGTVLDAFDEVAGIVIDNAEKTITLTITASETTAYTWRRGVFEWEVEDSTGFVARAKQGLILVDKEIATPIA